MDEVVNESGGRRTMFDESASLEDRVMILEEMLLHSDMVNLEERVQRLEEERCNGCKKRS